MFHVTTAQLTKAVTEVDYESGPHSSAKKRKTLVAEATVPSTVAETTTGSAPTTSKTRNPAANKVAPSGSTTQQDDTLSSSSDSDSLPEVPFK